MLTRRRKKKAGRHYTEVVFNKDRRPTRPRLVNSLPFTAHHPEDTVTLTVSVNWATLAC